MFERYVFDRSFDDTEGESPQAANILGKVAPLKEQAANQVTVPPQALKSYEEGFSDGFEKALVSKAQEREKTTLKVLQDIAQGLAACHQDQDKQNRDAVKCALYMVKEMLQKLFPSLLNNKHLAALDLTNTLEPLLKDLSQKSVKVVVHPLMMAFVEGQLKGMHKGGLSLEGDEMLSMGDCRVLWEQTRFEALKANVLEDIMGLLDNLMAMSESID